MNRNDLWFAAVVVLATSACADTETKGDDWDLDEPGIASPANTPNEVTAEGVRDDDHVGGKPVQSELYDFSAAIEVLQKSHWTEQMVGCVGSYVWHGFKRDPAYEEFEQMGHMGEDDEDAILWHVDGTWSIEADGTVQWSSEHDDSSRIERRTLALVNGELAQMLMYVDADDTDFAWPQGGFAPVTKDLLHFRNVQYQAHNSADYESESGMTVDLVLNSRPGEVAASALCTMTVTATRFSGEQLTRELTCSTVPLNDHSELVVLVADGMSADQWEAASAWREQLESEGFYDAVADEDRRVYDELLNATVPHFVFDPQNPDVLVNLRAYSVFGTVAP